MARYLKNLRELGLALSLGALLAAGLPAAHAEDASGHGGMHRAMQKHGAHLSGNPMAQRGKGHDGGKQGGRCKGHGGRQHRKGHGGRHLFSNHWKNTLTAEQQAQLDRLHLEFAKQKHALKSGIQALKVQLAVLTVADQPQQEAVDAHIDNMMMAKKRLMQAKFRYTTAQRAVLTSEQRVSFDMEVIHKADSRKAQEKHGGGKH
jgi:Spy/CpxP family protein refolding chaperone